LKIIYPSFEVEGEIDGDRILKKIERAGRTCYKSEAKITSDSSKEFVRRIIKSGHESVLEHESISVRVICDRGVTHEIVRHRLASYSQESTRYCNYSKNKAKNGINIIAPPNDWLDDKKYNGAKDLFKYAMECAETAYNRAIEIGWKPQMARGFLPNFTKTEIVMTMNLREWRHFFKLRTSKAAHPQMREIAIPMLEWFKNNIPVIFEDISEK